MVAPKEALSAGNSLPGDLTDATDADIERFIREMVRCPRDADIDT